MNNTIYYNSPVGILRISSNGDAITEVLFVETQKNGGEITTEISFLVPETGILKNCIQQLDDYFSGKNFLFSLPLMQPGTAFQKKVWKGLLDILPGKTCSYLQFSKNLGDVKAIRAVGAANGKNNIAIIVPCHRVIGSNGSLVGYAGDLWRKQWLLNHEATHCNGVQSLF